MISKDLFIFSTIVFSLMVIASYLQSGSCGVKFWPVNH